MTTEAKRGLLDALGTMLDADESERHWLRAETLRNLRWIAIGGQLATILVCEFVLGFDLPLTACLLAILASVWFNVIAWVSMPPNARLSERAALLWLVFDMAQLGVLLALTGGLTNPFSLLLIAPTTVAAAGLTPYKARIAVGVAFLVILAIETAHLPLNHANGPLSLPPTYHLGVACALVTGLIFIALYVRRVADEALAMSQALSATQLALSREQRLSSLGAMAAAAAHELGTPLATIALTAREMEHDADSDSPQADDLRLIREQTRRCRDILARLASEGRRDGSDLEPTPLLSLLQEAAAPHMRAGKRIDYVVNGRSVAGDGTVPGPMIPRKPEILHALRNLIQNAVEFARGTVRIEIDEPGGRLEIRIVDDGSGYPSDVLNRLGDPFLTSRRARRKRSGGYEGMGLGIFIAKTLLERSGATLTFSNRIDRSSAARGARVEISWPRAALLEGDIPAAST